MERQEILKEIESIFRIELEEPDLIISYGSTPDSIRDWDSISNLVLISAIEKKFNITFSVDAIFSMENVGDMVDFVYNSSQS